MRSLIILMSYQEHPDPFHICDSSVIGRGIPVSHSGKGFQLCYWDLTSFIMQTLDKRAPVTSSKWPKGSDMRQHS